MAVNWQTDDKRARAEDRRSARVGSLTLARLSEVPRWVELRLSAGHGNRNQNVISGNTWNLGCQSQPLTAMRSQVLRNGQWPVHKWRKVEDVK